jgi:hypothetical protein
MAYDLHKSLLKAKLPSLVLEFTDEDLKKLEADGTSGDGAHIWLRAVKQVFKNEDTLKSFIKGDYDEESLFGHKMQTWETRVNGCMLLEILEKSNETLKHVKGKYIALADDYEKLAQSHQELVGSYKKTVKDYNELLDDVDAHLINEDQGRAAKRARKMD